MIPNLDELRARRTQLKAELKRFAEPIALTRSEQERFDELAAEYDDIDGRIDELEQRTAMTQRAAAVLNDTNQPTTFAYHRSSSTKLDAITADDLQRVDEHEARSAALSWLEDAPPILFGGGDRQREDLAALFQNREEVGGAAARMAVATSSDAYREAWQQYMRGGDMACTEQQRMTLRRAITARDESRGMTAGTGSSGGYLVPLYLDPTLVITGTGTANQIRRISNTKQISTYTYNGATAAQVTASEVGEGSAFSDNSPTLTQVQFSMWKAGAYIPASFEAIEDIEGLTNDVAELFADAKANYEAARLTTGTGSSQPEGIVHAVAAVGGSKVAPATGGAMVVGDVYKTHQALPARYRHKGPQRRAFLASVNVINYIRQFATANVYHAFLTNLADGQPPQLLGEQLLETSDMDTSITTGSNAILFGSFENYLIVDRIGLMTEWLPMIFDQASGRPSGQRAWLCHWRWNTKCNDTNGFRVLQL